MTYDIAMKPDLADPQQRQAYRRELKSLYRGWRLAGFLLILAGAAGLFLLRMRPWPEPALSAACWVLIALGWIIFIAIIVRRTRYHKARMAGD